MSTNAEDHPDFKAAMTAVEDLFSNTGVGVDTTEAALSALRDRIDDLLDSLAEMAKAQMEGHFNG